jgi:hypothetical protein
LGRRHDAHCPFGGVRHVDRVFTRPSAMDFATRGCGAGAAAIT